MISTVFAFYRNLPCLTKPPMSTLGWSQPLWVGLVLLSSLVFEIQGHGRLMEPVSRASAWRRGYPNPADYNDNQGYCGGYSVRILTVFFGEFCCFAVFRNFLIFEKLCLQKYYLHWRVNFQFQCAKKMPALTLLISSFTLLCCQQTEA